MGKSGPLRVRGKELTTTAADLAAPLSYAVQPTGDSLAQMLGEAPHAIAQPARTTVYGTTYNDVITGTAGADRIEDAWGNDTIDGGDGDDVIVDYGGSNLLHGGLGNDYIFVPWQGRGTLTADDIETSTIDGGDGADVVELGYAVHQRLTIDLGAGNDLLLFSAPYVFDNDIHVRTGADADRVVLDLVYGDALRSQMNLIVIDDFTAGAGGDVIEFGEALKGLLAYQGGVAANPFDSGHLRLIQDGADVIVRVDLDGTGGQSDGWYIRDIFRLTNVSVNALTSYNLGGIDPAGAAAQHGVQNGTAGVDGLHADQGGSDLYGLGGNDRLYGGAGDDLLDGGANDDILRGGLGNDVLRGGDGNDTLDDDGGNDLLEGGAGDDIIAISRPALDRDRPGVTETITINAGDGQDLVSFDRQPREDTQHQALRKVVLRVDLGAGDDRLVLTHYFDDMQFTLGAGEDHVVIGGRWDETTGPIVITDFAAGTGGDVFELDRTLIGVNGWDGLSNPFAGGWLLLKQQGADTLVVFDYDGFAGGDQGAASVFTLALLRNVDAASLTAFNFNGWAPGGAASTFVVTNGTAGDDTLYDGNGNDVIDGGAGNDRIEARKAGNDSLSGGDGDDVIIVAHPNNQQLPEVITVNAGAGNDVVEYAANYGSLTADLGAGDDRITIFAPATSTITLGTGQDIVVIDPGFGIQAGDGVITITDFATGNGGDRLDWTLYGLYESFNETADQRAKFGPVLNPFLTDNFRLVQSGADTLLQAGDYLDGTANPLVYTTIVRFQNTSATAFNTWNIGFDPYLPTQNGGAFDDVLTGAGDRDVLFGNNGNDQLNGLGGDDLLRGYDGNDVLAGSQGNDYLVGGLGDDNLSGGEGNDFLHDLYGRNLIDGGAGNDIIYVKGVLSTITGGDGADTITTLVGSAVDGDVAGSLDAGDGNDLVYVTSGGRTDYAVNLGAGDDIIHFNRSFGTLTLGAGRDTIVFEPAINMGLDVVIADFATGNAGDIFDLATYLDGRGSGTYGLNPFALGYVELRQVGNDVELYLWRDGFPDDDIFDKQKVIRFLNTDIDDFTAANFGGFDPHAQPNRPLLVRDSMVVAAGQTLDSLNIAPSDFGGAHVIFRGPTGNNVDFVNHGTITSRATSGFAVTGAFVDSWIPGGTFLNASDGRFIVRNDYAPPYGAVLSNIVTWGFQQGDIAMRFQNDGYFEVTAVGGIAFGFGGGDDTRLVPFINNGTFTVSSGYEAYGVRFGAFGQFQNTGAFSVHGGEFAVGVWFFDYQDGQFSNNGSITVTTDPGSPYASIGLLAYHGNSPLYNFSNAGTITADIAFLSDDHDSPTSDNGDNFVNTGTINGDMVMGDGIDRLTNSGTMTGYADMGLRDDAFDGFTGIYNGIIDGGAGNDTLIANRGVQVLFGNYGDDKLYAGEGDDILIGGRGSDAVDGGAGFDLMSYATSWAAVSLDFATGLAFDGGGNDRFRNMEGVVGSAYADTLRGGDANDFLEGAGGNDVISGGGGADTILGDTGNDDLTGGAGADVFMFSIGDGADTVTDFNAQEDTLDIYGYSGAQQILQVGSDTRVVLSATESILLRNVQAASLLIGDQLVFHIQELTEAPAPNLPRVDTQLAGSAGFLLYAGETMHIVDPAYDQLFGVYEIRHAGVSLLQQNGTANAMIAGTVNLEVSGQSSIATAFFHPFDVTVLATGSVDVETSGAIMAIGVHGGNLLNAGHFRVASAASDAPVLDDYDYTFTSFGRQGQKSSAIGAWGTSGVGINNGTLEVVSTRISTGIISFGNSDADKGYWNTGNILVSGALESMGVLFQGTGLAGNTARPNFVNTGNIVVTDTNAIVDSIGLAISFTTGDSGSGPYAGVGARFWNSGKIEADYAVKWYVSVVPDDGGVYTFYNSGELRGLVDLSAGDETIYNSGLITGRIDLHEGNDLFDGRGGSQLAGVAGGFGNDTLYGGSLADIIDGGGGDDVIAGGAGADLLTGGAGNDIFHVEAGFGADTITDFAAGGSEDAIRVSGYSNYQSLQQVGADTLVTFSATDTILLKNVVAASLTGADFIFSAAALSSATMPAAPGQPASLNFTLNPSNAPLFAAIPGLTLNGTTAGDKLIGDTGNDVLDGGAGNDVLAGGEGNDRLIGGGGSDRMSGGSGSDTFVFNSLGDSREAAMRSDGKKILPDVITDYAVGVDKLDLSAIDANVNTGANDAFSYIGNSAFTHQAGQLRWEAIAGGINVFADVDGDGRADLQILVQGTNINFMVPMDFVL